MIFRRAVTVSIVTQGCIHAEDRIREQATHCANFAQIIGIDPLVIAVPYFLYTPCWAMRLSGRSGGKIDREQDSQTNVRRIPCCRKEYAYSH